MAVQGGTLFYDDQGSGPVIVLLHAGGRDHTMWDAQVQTFTRGFRVIRYDLRGHGRSTAPLGPFDMAEDLRRVLDHLNVEHARLVGVSMGAAVFMDDADEYEALVTCADKAMYEAKKAGRGRLSFSSGAIIELEIADCDEKTSAA